MSKIVVSLAAVLAGVAGTAGAALATEPATPAPAAAVATASVAKAPAAPKASTAPKAVAVVIVRTGGAHRGQSVFTQVGASSRQEAEVLRLASSPAFRALRPRYASAGAAGRYTYRIEAGYQNDTKKRVTVVEGTPGTPKVALDIIRLMTDTSDLADAFPPGFPFN